MRAAPSVCCGLALLLAGCRAAPSEHRLYAAFGTLVDVEIADAPSAERDRSLERLDDYLNYLDFNWRPFGAGELGRLNEDLQRVGTDSAGPLSGEARGRAVSMPLARLIRRSLELGARSGGLFDVRVGPLVKLWGFQDLTRPPVAPPAESDVARLRERALTPDNVQEKGDRVWSQSAVALDFGSIGKGSALSGAAALLRAHGMNNFLVNAGGDIYVVGSRAGAPWRIGVRDPRSTGILGVLVLESGETLSSSGDYERFFESGNRRYHHIIDPRTGQPSTGTAGTTVLARDAELAHVASTGLMVAGRAGFDALLSRLAIDCALLVTDDGTVIMTPVMRKRLRPAADKL